MDAPPPEIPTNTEMSLLVGFMSHIDLIGLRTYYLYVKKLTSHIPNHNLELKSLTIFLS